jgi:GAF domain-containing protein/HAMP domain-containing protein
LGSGGSYWPAEGFVGEGQGLKPVEPIVEKPAGAPSEETALLHRGQLFRKYFLLILALVCGALLISGGVGLYFAYHENKDALSDLQREKAAGAAARIEQYVLQIEQHLSSAALTPLGVEGLEQRRIEFLKLLRMVPDVTDISQIDARGREQVFESRIGMSTLGSNEDRSQLPVFSNARADRTWFSPVYFRKDTEPYMSIAVRAGESGPVTVAEVNLKFMWDVITRIRIGQKGRAYVVDGTGHLIADPDIGLVLRKTNLSSLEQVKAAFAPGADDSLAMVATDFAGNRVLTAYAPIEPGRHKPPQAGPASPLGWKVFVEQPVSEVYAALDATILRTVALIVAGLLFSALAAMWLARSMVRPINILQEGAQRIGAGDLDQQIDVRTGDELQALAEQFNHMTAQLRESYAGLERKVDERTAELKQALEFQRATGEILASISGSIADTQPVFDAIVRNLLRLLDTEFAIVRVLRDDKLCLAAFAGQPGYERVIADRREQPVDADSVSGRAVLSRQILQFAPISSHPDMPERTKVTARNAGYDAIIAAPMVREDRVVGVIATARKTGVPFNEKQVALIKAFADQAVIAIENARLFNETKEALERQTATAEILKVISSTPTDVQPVFDAIVKSALHLLEGHSAVVTRVEAEIQYLGAYTSTSPAGDESLRSRYPRPLTRQGNTAIATRKPRVIADYETDPDLHEEVRETARLRGYRSSISVPMLREGTVVGTISVSRRGPGTFPDHQIKLLQTFADQAVIAIENVRLFNETKESLEQQTATSEILKVISSSTTDTQPVFEAIVQSGLKLFPDAAVVVTLPDGDQVQLAAIANLDPRHAEEWRKRFPFPLSREYMHGLAILERRMIDMPDAAANTDASIAPGIKNFLASGYRAVTIMPMMRGEAAIGTVSVVRSEPGPLTEKQLALLRTFADQAVIAIENVRLFNETKESLEQQTATSEILRVISDSPGDVKPILDAVAERATRLCEATAATLYVLEGATLRRTAFHGPAELQGRETLPYTPGTLTGRAIAEGKPIHVQDLERAQSEFPMSWEFARQFGRHQTTLAVPLLREGRPFGTMFLRRTEVRPFSERQIALAKVFADQAAIGIENVRLFNETREALEQQKAAADVLGAISASIADTAPVFDKILESCQRLFEGYLVGVTLVEADGQVHLRAYKGERQDELPRIYPMPLSRESGTGFAILEQRVIEFSNVQSDASTPPQVRKGAAVLGFASIVFAPMIFEGRGIGAIWVARKLAGAFSEKQIALLKTFADQAVIAIQNARLFREIQEKGAQLEIANKHKSEFLANMSHELRTPLNAIIGFSEVLIEKMFGEVNAKQADYLKDIHESGRHLLSLINDILDLSKIEAGRMDLEISTFDLPTALSNAMTLVRERAQRHGIELSLAVDKKLGAFQADERKFKQIVLNLLSNAVKFTPDGGRVDVSAKRYDGKIEVAVRDTGIGIAPEDHAAVFEEFKQVGRDYTKKAEGTGLGLTLTKRFVELHGGSIHLQSSPGKGSTFTITLPVHQ